MAPRGHYVGDPGAAIEDSLESYFLAMMWLSRTELNLVSLTIGGAAAPPPREP